MSGNHSEKFELLIDMLIVSEGTQIHIRIGRDRKGEAHNSFLMNADNLIETSTIKFNKMLLIRHASILITCSPLEHGFPLCSL